MARMKQTILDPNDRFPELRLCTVEGAECVLPRIWGRAMASCSCTVVTGALSAVSSWLTFKPSVGSSSRLKSR